MINVGLIGCGHWGFNYIRCYNKIKNANIAATNNINKECLARVKKLNPQVKLTQNYKDILTDNSIKAVIVATSVMTHYTIIKECLKNGKDVFAEKPLTIEAKTSLELAELAKKLYRKIE